MPLPEVLGAAQLSRTVDSIAAVQHPTGALPWPDGHTDPWDHVECAMALVLGGRLDAARAAYRWLARTQERRRQLGELVGRHQRARRRRRHQPVRLRRGRAVAVVAGDRRPGARRRALAGRPARPRPRRVACSCPAGRSPGRATPTASSAATRCSPAPRPPTSRCAAASRWPSWWGSPRRAGRWRPAWCSTPWRTTRGSSSTRAGSRWTGTTRSSAAPSAAQPPRRCSTAAGTSSSCRAGGPAASPTGPG